MRRAWGVTLLCAVLGGCRAAPPASIAAPTAPTITVTTTVYPFAPTAYFTGYPSAYTVALCYNVDGVNLLCY